MSPAQRTLCHRTTTDHYPHTHLLRMHTRGCVRACHTYSLHPSCTHTHTHKHACTRTYTHTHIPCAVGGVATVRADSSLPEGKVDSVHGAIPPCTIDWKCKCLVCIACSHSPPPDRVRMCRLCITIADSVGVSSYERMPVPPAPVQERSER